MSNFNYTEPCSRCQNIMYLGSGGFDGEGDYLSYLCPNCGNESPDIIPDVDDILPAKIAWSRAPNGTIHWDKDILVFLVQSLPRLSSPSEMIWCDRCQCFVSKKDLRRWTGDDALHHLCPGCDSDLLPVGKLE